MFCPKCGQQIADDAQFCMHCGNAINATAPAPAPAQPVVDYQAQKNAIRQSEMKSLSDALEHFNKKRSEFEEYDLVCDLVGDFSRGAKSALLVWGIIISAFSLLALFGSLSEGEMGGVLGSLLFITLPGAMMIVGGILMKKNNKRKRIYFENEYARLSQELYDHYASYPNCPVGPEYANPEILEILLGILQSGKADTVKEAINIALSEADRAEVNEYLNMIERNTANINANTRAAAFFAAANFFKD